MPASYLYCTVAWQSSRYGKTVLEPRVEHPNFNRTTRGDTSSGLAATTWPTGHVQRDNVLHACRQQQVHGACCIVLPAPPKLGENKSYAYATHRIEGKDQTDFDPLVIWHQVARTCLAVHPPNRKRPTSDRRYTTWRGINGWSNRRRPPPQVKCHSTYTVAVGRTTGRRNLALPACLLASCKASFFM